MPLRPLSLVLAAIVAAAPGIARGEEPEQTPAESTEAAPQAPQSPPLLHGMLELSLTDAIRMGLENNLDVQVERYSPLLADLDVTAAWGAYDPEAFAEFHYQHLKTPSASVFTGPIVRDETSQGFGGLRALLPYTSTELKGQFEGSDAKSNVPTASLSPQYNSGWSLDLTQPLLRDLYWNQPWTQVRTTRLLYSTSEEEFSRGVMDSVQQIEDAYWTLIANEEALRVANKSLETARALLDQTKTQYEVGVVSKVEVTEAEAGVSQREVERIRAENRYRNQQDVLIDLVLGPNLRAASTLEIRPTDRPEDFVPYEVDVEAAVTQAFEHRPEYAGAVLDVERGEVQQSFARNQMLPELDALFRFAQSGLSGSPNPNELSFSGNSPTPPQGDWHRSFDDYNDTPQYMAGARFSIPFPNNTARANASKSELELSRSRTNLRRLEQQIIIQVRQAARNLLASQEGITAAKNARIAAEEQLRAEQIRLEYGESTPFDVLQRESDLVERELEEIQAFQAYRTSVTALDRAQGTILRNRNIDIAQVAPLR
jgi:outer membrane protein